MKKIIGFFIMVLLLESCYTQYPIKNYYTPFYIQTRANINTYKHIKRNYPHRAYKYQHYRYIY